MNSVFGLYLGKKPLMVSLKAKLKAWGGKRMTLAMLPRQNDATPCSEATRLKQLITPVYLGTLPLIMSGLASCVWMSSLTRSIGATRVLEMPPETPPAARSAKNFRLDSSFFEWAVKPLSLEAPLYDMPLTVCAIARWTGEKFMVDDEDASAAGTTT